MSFIIIPDGGIRGGKPEKHQTYKDASDVAERKAVEQPGTRFEIFATVATVYVPIPNPIWNVEGYVPEHGEK